METTYLDGGVVRSLRQALGWSQSKLADAIGLDQSTISQYEIGRAEPSIEVLIKLRYLSEGTPVREDVDRLISSRMGPNDDVWDRIFEDINRGEGKGSRLSADFAAEVSAYLTNSRHRAFDASPDLLRLLRLYREHYGDAGFESAFRKAADFVEVELRQPTISVAARKSGRSLERKTKRVKYVSAVPDATGKFYAIAKDIEQLADLDRAVESAEAAALAHDRGAQTDRKKDARGAGRKRIPAQADGKGVEELGLRDTPRSNRARRRG